MNLSEKLKKKLEDIPDNPGCYIMRDRHGRIIYVGKARSLRKRVQSYFRKATFRRSSPKLRGLIKSIHDLDYIILRNEAEASLTEGQLIKDYKPRYNVSFKDDKRFLILRADPAVTFPSFKLCRIRRNDNAVYFGPYVSSSAARALLDFTEKKFGLRKCTSITPDENTYKHCINDIVRYCSAPCIKKVTREIYKKQFKEACLFLRGERPKYLKDIQKQMNNASLKLEFEHAAVLRDTFLLLQSIIKQKVRVAPTLKIKQEDGKAGIIELRRVFKLKKAPRVIEAYDVSNISGTYSVAGMVCFIDGMPKRNRYRRFRIKTIKGANDPGMMAEVIRRRFRRLIKEGNDFPDMVLVDGGIAQFQSATAELHALGINNIAVAGLAKRLEEIYWKKDCPPIRLKKNSKALKILQHLRDEAHRFAITYHRRLRAERIKESILDEIPGIGKKRKEQILKHFGSVRQLKKITESQIATLPGISYNLACIIKNHINVF